MKFTAPTRDELRELLMRGQMFVGPSEAFDFEAAVNEYLDQLLVAAESCQRVSALHIPHRDSHKHDPSRINGPWYCCASVQLGVRDPDECNVCRVPWPCDTARAVGFSRSKVICASHAPVQHRDGKPPWCPVCGLTADGQEPVSPFSKKESK